MDSIVAAPGVRLDLNDGATWTLHSDTEFGMPHLDRAIVSTLMGDGAQVPASAYGLRLLRIVANIQTLTEDLDAAELQKLFVELNRQSNFVKWQPAVANPLFFRTLRSAATTVHWDPVLKRVEVEILAEPFALGLRETLPTISVSNDAAAVSNGLYFDVTAPKGDVETPLFLSTTATDLNQRVSVIGTRRRGTPAAMPFIVQAEALGAAAAADTTLQPNDPAMSGPGSNYWRVTFATQPSMQQRLSIGTWPAAPSVDTRGTYRVFARVRKSIPGDGIALRLRAVAGQYVVTNDLAATTFGSQLHWVDLGQVSFPLGVDPGTDGYSGEPIPVRGLTFEVHAGRTGGTSAGTLDIDVLAFVPADDRLAVIKWPNLAFPAAFVLDSARAMAYAIDAGPVVRSTELAQIAGSTPMISPGVTNRIAFLKNVGTTVVDDKTEVSAITPYYWPRYLYVRPATT